MSQKTTKDTHSPRHYSGPKPYPEWRKGIYRALFNHKEIRHMYLKTALAMWQKMDPCGYVTVFDNAKLAEYCDYSKRTAQRHPKELEAVGVLRIIPHTHPSNDKWHGPNDYQVIIPPVYRSEGRAHPASNYTARLSSHDNESSALSHAESAQEFFFQTKEREKNARAPDEGKDHTPEVLRQSLRHLQRGLVLYREPGTDGYQECLDEIRRLEALLAAAEAAP